MGWAEFRPLEALACLPAIILLLASGLALDDPLAGLAASSGALVVGFGAFQQDFRDPAVPMILVSIGMSFSAGIGTLVHVSLPLDLACVALWSFGLGLMNVVGRGPGWLALQGSIALVLAAALPATPVYAAMRFVLVLAGGAVQFFVVQAIRSLATGRLFAPNVDASVTVESILSQVRAIITGHAPGLPHAVMMALALSVGELVYQALDLPNGYWVPMTVLLILRPAARETVSRGLARLIGTLCGVVLLTLLMALLRPAVPVLMGLVAATAWTGYAFLRVNYMVLSLALTMYVVLLFAIAGLPEPVVALRRAVATLLGGAIALLTHLLGLGVVQLWRRYKAWRLRAAY